MRPNVALELVEWAGLKPVHVRSDRVRVRCPFHDDRRPSADVFDSGVLACFACGNRSPFTWLVELGRLPADVMAELERLGLRDREEWLRRRPPGASRAPASSFGRKGDRAKPRPQEAPQELEPPARVELGPELLERLEAARFERRRVDARLAELRGFAPDVLDAAGVAIGRPAGYGFRGPRRALRELRLLLPVRDERRGPLGLLALAPNPARRAEPKILARPGSPRRLLELLDVDEPLAPLLLVCEGELDALTVASAGLRAIGVPGVAGFPRHAARIAELVRKLELELALLLPDADDAGRRAFYELAAAIAAAGAPAVFADVLDDGADVGSFLVEAADELERERPELAPADRRREAGRRLLSLATDAAG
jgi:Toprim-like